MTSKESGGNYLKPAFAALSLVALLLVACGGGPAQTAAPPGVTQAPGVATPAPGVATPAAPPPVGGAVATVILTGGPDAGTYTGSENPNCSFGIVGEGIWGTQYSTATAGAGQLSSIQTIIPPAGSTDAEFSMTVTIGVLFEGNDYGLTSETGSAQVTDGGATAVIHATGTTEDGVTMDVTINCPSVFRV
jgi:hypothetical protein